MAMASAGWEEIVTAGGEDDGAGPSHASNSDNDARVAAVTRASRDCASSAAIASNASVAAMPSTTPRRRCARIALVYRPVFRSRFEVTRRQFIKAAAGAAWLPSLDRQVSETAST